MMFHVVLVHSFTKTDLTKSLPANESESNYIFFRDYIPRHSSSAAIVVQGVKENESASLNNNVDDTWFSAYFSYNSCLAS